MGIRPPTWKTSSSKASVASSSLPKTQGCRAICSDGVNPEGAGQAFVPFPWKLRRAASSHFGGTKGRLAGPASPAGELGHRAGRPHPHRQEPPLSFLDVSGELGLQSTAAFPAGLLESLTFSNLFFHPVTDLSQENYVSFSSFEGKSATSTQKKCSETYSIPQTGSRRGESIQEMLKKVKVRRVLIALPDAGVSPEIHREQS